MSKNKYSVYLLGLLMSWGVLDACASDSGKSQADSSSSVQTQTISGETVAVSNGAGETACCAVTDTSADAQKTVCCETADSVCCETVVETIVDPMEYFAINEIDDEVFGRIKGKSYKDDCTVPLSDLRYLTVAYYDGEGNVQKGEIICNKLIADDLLDIFQNLYAAEYPIERIRLIDEYDADDRTSMRANNTSSFNYRVVAGTNKLSKHALGMAIDINPLYNPWVKNKGKGQLAVSPEEGRPYADRSKDFPYKIDENDLVYKEFKKHGFIWGGHWNSIKDYQHFEK